MARIEMKGLDEYTKALSRLEMGVKVKVIGPAVYAGADIVADAIRAGIEALPEDGGIGTPQDPLKGPNELQKDGLLASFGISRMQDRDGVENVKLGFDGYNSIRTRRWPQGQPNAMVARSVERGTSFMLANPFLKKAVALARKAALEVMRKTVDKGVKDAMNQ